ncbi:hypothetical protein B0T22DRAFT_447584 [Podospora appendiculata]|uniref:Uncharacterized protein n=1 Tax=Podospora appendiculata TaxID=314037 RepID=A0AAE1CFR8_9PEZI|nr:hypothetical protein B0T22DRAFT_447584 [Podospora appendiculata]
MPMPMPMLMAALVPPASCTSGRIRTRDRFDSIGRSSVAAARVSSQAAGFGVGYLVVWMGGWRPSLIQPVSVPYLSLSLSLSLCMIVFVSFFLSLSVSLDLPVCRRASWDGERVVISEADLPYQVVEVPRVLWPQRGRHGMV